MNTWIVINNSYPGNKLRQGFQVPDYRYPVCFELMFYSSITLREAHLSPTLEWHTESMSPVTFTYLLSPLSTPRLAWLLYFFLFFVVQIQNRSVCPSSTTQVNMTQIGQCNLNVIASLSFKSKGSTRTPQFVDDAAGN